MKSLRAAALLCILALLPLNSASADVISPEGLAPEAPFRIVFVTSETRDATSTSINIYDTFVGGLADNAGLGWYRGEKVEWKAIASTSSVSAISRLPNSSVPLFLVNGDQVSLAPSDHDIWWPLPIKFDEHPQALAAPINVTEKGIVLNNVTVWTGTQVNGIGAGTVSLGGSGDGGTTSSVGNSGKTDVTWIYQPPGPFATLPRGEAHYFYGVSNVLYAVPEPGCLALWTMALVVGGGYGIWRRKR